MIFVSSAYATGIDNTYYGACAASQTREHVYLILSILFLLFAFFMLHESVAIMRRIPAQEKEITNPRSGVLLAWFSSLCIITLWLRQSVPALIDPSLYDSGVSIAIISLLWCHPVNIMPAFILSGVLPLIIAAYKFMASAHFIHSAILFRDQASRRLSIVAMLFGIISIVGLLGSIASILSYYRTY